MLPSSEQSLQQHQHSILLGVTQYPLKSDRDAGDLEDLKDEFFPKAMPRRSSKRHNNSDDTDTDTDTDADDEDEDEDEEAAAVSDAQRKVELPPWQEIGYFFK